MIARSWLRALCLLPAVLTMAASSPTPTPTPSTASGSRVQATPLASPKSSVVPGAAGTTNSAGLTKEVFGFATAGSLGDPTIGYPSWNFNLLSTVAFFSIGVNYNGVLIGAPDADWNVWDSSTLTGLVNTAHAHGVRVVLTIKPAYNDTVDFCDMLYNWDTTVIQTVNQVVAKGVDGVNIDFEGQLAQCNPTNPGFTPDTDQNLFTNLVKQMRAGLDAKRPGYYLSVDTYSASAEGNGGFFNIAALNLYVDSFFVMTYDMDVGGNATLPPLSCVSFCFNPVSPLQNYFYNDSKSMTEYSSLVGANKVILGQPYYARGGCVAGPTEHAKPTGSVFTATYLSAVAAESSPDVRAGTYVIHRDSLDAYGYDRWDSWYDQSVPCWREMYWSDTTQLGTRYDLVNTDGLRGVGIWTLNYGGGAPELWNALQNHFLGCSSVTDTTSPTPPQPGATPVAVNALANCPDPNPLFAFWLLKPGASSYTLVQNYSTSAVWNWDTSGLPPGTYRINVWVKDALTPGLFGNTFGRFDTYNALTTFTITSTPCAGVSGSAAPSPAMVGSQVTVTEVASGGCAKPQFEFWILSPGASRYVLARPYGTVPTFTWSTGGNGAGIYRVAVWVRDTSSWGVYGNASGRYDAYNAGLLITLTRSCPSVAESAPSSTATIGSTVTITASAPGCLNPVFEFWVLKPGASSYTQLQPYGSSNTLSWVTTGLPGGTYRFNVWVHDASDSGLYANSSGRYDAYNASLTITLS